MAFLPKCWDFFIGHIYQQVTRRIPVTVVGKRLGELTFKGTRKRIFEFVGEVGSKKYRNSYRVIGFWNPLDKKNQYITKLSAAENIIYPLYRLRQQLELIFKGCKQSLNLDHRLISNNDNIIESLVLALVVACFASQVVLNFGSEQLSKKQKLAISFQRIAYIVDLLAKDFIDYLTRSSAKYSQTLLDRMNLFVTEMIEKNYQHRPISMAQFSNAFNE